MTSPEELLAAAHASCFAMQFTSGLVGAGWEPGGDDDRRATVSFEIGRRDHRVALTARGDRRRAHRRADLRDRPAGEDHVPDLARPRRDRDHARAARPRSATRTTKRTPRPRSPGRVGRPTAGTWRAMPIRRTRRRARALLPGDAGAHVRPCGLQRPPRGGGGRPAPEEARGPLQARAGVAPGARRPRGGAAPTPSWPRWSPTTRPRSRGSRRS